MRVPAIIWLAVAGLSFSSCVLTPIPLPGGEASTCSTGSKAIDDAGLMIAVRVPDCRGGSIFWGNMRSPTVEFGYFTKDHETPARITQTAFEEALRDQVRNHGAPIIYIHGYRNSAVEANKRALTIQTATGGHRPVVTIVWPSYRQTTKYYWDEANNEWAQKSLLDQVRQILQKHDQADLVAHSMGNRFVVDLLTSNPDVSTRLAHVVMASPDVDRQTLEQLLARPDGLGADTTVYASTKDQALATSWRLHGYPRAGDLARSAGNDKPQQGLYSELRRAAIVDTSPIRESHIGHDDFVSTPQGLTDLCLVLSGKNEELGATREGKAGHWKLKARSEPSSCDANVAAALPRPPKRSTK